MVISSLKVWLIFGLNCKNILDNIGCMTCSRDFKYDMINTLWLEKIPTGRNYISDKKIGIVDIPPGYTHSIENLTDGNDEMILLI